jgi:hypothetical protein
MSEHTEHSDALAGEELDLAQYEAEFVVESDGLTIAAYCIDGEYLLDFDWEDGSIWEPLNDPAVFEEFTANLLTRLTGEVAVNPSDVLEDLLQEEDPAAGACSLG